MDDALPFPIGSLVDGRYRLVAVLGQGGMGAVYRAEQVSLQREVALKVLRTDVGNTEAAARFSREALALSRLDHPNVVRVIDSGQAEGRPYLVMELVSGRDLQGELFRGPMRPEQAVPILGALCEALAAAHAQGIIHRDLKPENVILTEQGVPKILDFGIAVAADGSARVTQVGFVLGTPEYMAPEQAMGQLLTPRSDLYTLGVMAYRMLSGQLPFQASDPREYLVLHAGTPCPPIEEKWPQAKEWPELCGAVMRALHKDPEKRYPDALAMKRALEDGLAHRAPAPEGSTKQLRSTEIPRSATSVLAVRTQNLAVLFAELTGWTERTTAMPPHAVSALQARFEAVMVPVAKRFGARKVKAIGGTLIFSLPSPTGAVELAMALQDRLWEERRGGTHDLLSARMAISIGEVTPQDGDLYGEPVNIASRVLELAKDGEVLFTDAIYLLMNRSELLADELGPQTLKGIPYPVRVFRVRQASVPELPPYNTRGPGSVESVSRALRSVRFDGTRRVLVLGAFAALGVAAAGVHFWRSGQAPRPVVEVPRAQQPVLAKAQAALERKQPREAAALLAPILAQKPVAPDALALGGRVAIAQGDWVTGLERLRDAAKVDPEQRPPLVEAAIQALQQPTKGKSCPVRTTAITLLTAFDAAEARTELARIATSRECGSDEARAALGVISTR